MEQDHIFLLLALLCWIALYLLNHIPYQKYWFKLSGHKFCRACGSELQLECTDTLYNKKTGKPEKNLIVVRCTLSYCDERKTIICKWIEKAKEEPNEESKSENN